MRWRFYSFEALREDAIYAYVPRKAKKRTPRSVMAVWGTIQAAATICYGRLRLSNREMVQYNFHYIDIHYFWRGSQRFC
jgi:hypothetical protein